MIKNFVLDTNVLLHNPAALASFTDNNVIIPIVVVEELDKFKASADKKGMHARQALREIDSLIKKGALDKGAKMENGGTLKISFSSGENLPDCDASLNDNKILVVALELQKKGEKVIFVSKDVNARIKAAAFGLKTSDFEKQKVQYDTLYKGWRELLLPSSEIAKLYKDKKLKVKEKLLKNEYLLLKAEDKQNESALAKYVSEEDCIVPLPNYYDAMGIKPLNMEQRFAFDLLLDDKVKLVSFGKLHPSSVASLITATLPLSPASTLPPGRPILPSSLVVAAYLSPTFPTINTAHGGLWFGFIFVLVTAMTPSMLNLFLKSLNESRRLGLPHRIHLDNAPAVIGSFQSSPIPP